VQLICLVQVHAVEAAHGEREHDLHEAEDRVRDVGDGHLGAMKDAHVVFPFRISVSVSVSVSYRGISRS
jgi:hypothetical protein